MATAGWSCGGNAKLMAISVGTLHGSQVACTNGMGETSLERPLAGIGHELGGEGGVQSLCAGRTTSMNGQR